REAEDANLKSKEKIEELELLWGKQSEDSQKVKAVCAMLQPPINLKSLNIGLAATFSQRPENTWYEDIGDNWPRVLLCTGR
ncbi:putative NB-ARC domain disease resistance protein, partial [Trifolium pratense]